MTNSTDTPGAARRSWCSECGAPVSDGWRFCSDCGTPVTVDVPAPDESARAALLASLGVQPAEHATAVAEPAPSAATPVAATPVAAAPPPPPPPPPAPARPVTEAAAPATPPRPGAPTVPVELWLVIAAFAIPGAWLLLHAVGALPDSLRLIGSTLFGWRIGLALTVLVVLIGLLGVGMLLIAWKLFRLDRVGRGLAYVVAGTVILSVLIGGTDGGSDVAALIGSVIGVAILAASPNVRAAFTGPQARESEVPTSVIVSRVSISVFCAFATLVAFAYFLLASIEGSYALVAIVALAIVGFAAHASARLMRADRAARAQLSVGAGVLIVLALVAGKADLGLAVPLGLIAGTVAFLWIPNDARAFFGDAPLNLSGSGAG